MYCVYAKKLQRYAEDNIAVFKYRTQW